MNTKKEILRMTNNQPKDFLGEELTKKQIDMCMILFKHTFWNLTAAGLLSFKHKRHEVQELSELSSTATAYHIANQVLYYFENNLDDDKIKKELKTGYISPEGLKIYLNLKLGKLKLLIKEYYNSQDINLSLVCSICKIIREINYIAG